MDLDRLPDPIPELPTDARECIQLRANLLALQENPTFRWLLKHTGIELQTLQEDIFSGAPLTRINGVYSQQQQIGEARGLKRLPELMVDSINALNVRIKELNANETEPTV